MVKPEVKGILEGLLFASGEEGVSTKQLAHILEIKEKLVQAIIEELDKDYEQSNRGITIMRANQMYHLTTKPEHSLYFKRLLKTPISHKISQAGLETLAIIAYQQPITRVEIEEIRGVNSDRPVQTLVARSLVEEIGRKDAVGRPVLFGTSKDFLTYFGLTSIEELPSLPEPIETEGLEKEADLFFARLNKMGENSKKSV